LSRHYRERWEFYGHDPARIAIGAGTAGLLVTRTSQEATEAYRPVFESTPAFQKQFGLPVVFETVEDFVERSSALIGSPQQIVDKVHRYHEQFGHTVLHLHADADGLTDDRHRASLELFQSEVAPVLRRDIPDPPFAWGPVLPVIEEPAHA
jgi:alkanesulfonate monooxygenase SsuD/methylene tetrahydromethanopterin reductase-like flavin-dependent oxidoreductase (luciferase family)